MPGVRFPVSLDVETLQTIVISESCDAAVEMQTFTLPRRMDVNESFIFRMDGLWDMTRARRTGVNSGLPRKVTSISSISERSAMKFLKR
jgi:hypothetical protein